MSADTNKPVKKLDKTCVLSVQSDIKSESSMEEHNEDTTSLNANYSNFSAAQRRWIAVLVAFAGIFSPLSSFIYYPAVHSIALDLGVTLELIILTITSYMIVSGVTPAFFGDLADVTGRRPVYIFTFVITFTANIGLALQRSYPALLILRMVQSVGGSGT